MPMERLLHQQKEIADQVRRDLADNPPPDQTDPDLDRLVTEIIGRIADKWTMLVLEHLGDHGTLRFTRLADLLDGISQKMLTKTLRQMERDGLLRRTVHPVIPPHVDYCLTTLGQSLGAAFCGVWMWAEKNRAEVLSARSRFDDTPPSGVPRPRITIPRSTL